MLNQVLVSCVSTLLIRLGADDAPFAKLYYIKGTLCINDLLVGSSETSCVLKKADTRLSSCRPRMVDGISRWAGHGGHLPSRFDHQILPRFTSCSWSFGNDARIYAERRPVILENCAG